ncbi:hypothetical protein TNCV_3377501 [Trichonephila clavipes]|nr:hypothetical protein TNCV_3377501 [Trichonephila clavipes]
MPLDNKCRIGPLAGAPPDTCAVVIITETESGFITEDDTSPVCHTQVARVRQKSSRHYDVGSVVSVLADVGSSSQLRSVVSLWFLLMALDVWKEGQTRHQFLLKARPRTSGYEGNRRDAVLLGTSSGRVETTLAWLRSGHTRAQRHVTGPKVYPSCPNCNGTQVAPVDILACISCHKSQLLSSPVFIV